MSADCPCENKKQSKFSPDKVANNETLLFALVEPHNFEDNGIKKRAFSRSELKSKQVSVSRREYTDKTSFQSAVITPLTAKDGRRFIGVLKATCQDVRLIRTKETPSQRAVCVVDNGLEHDEAHAHLGFSEIAASQDKNQQSAHRLNLLRVFDSENILPLEAVFSA